MRRIVFCVLLLCLFTGWHTRARAELLSTPKIVGGLEATPNEFPFMAYIYYSGSVTSHRCGGTLIAPTWVLTAAHCVSGYSASSFRVAMGMHSRYGTNPYMQTSGITRIINHPNYNASIYDYDIALLELATPMTLSAQVGTAAIGVLPTHATLYADGASTTVAGWGTTSYGGSSATTLRKVTVPVVQNDHCDDAYLLLSTPQPITARMMCAGQYDLGGIDACQGDSGGPLFTISGNVFTVVGIVSSGEGCAWKDYPGIYTRVSFFQSWITSYTGVPGPVETLTPSITPSFSVTPSETYTPSLTRTRTATATQTETATQTSTRTATRTPTVTPTPLPIALKSVASGASFSVAALYNGTLVSWGFNAKGQSRIPLGLAKVLFAQVSAGNNYTIALSRSGRVYGWGANDFAQLNIPTDATVDVAQISAGTSHVLAVKKDGTVLCWGSTLVCSGKPTGLNSVTAVAAGNGFSVALTTTGQVVAWGKNTVGQSSVPVAARTNIIAIAAGNDHALALTDAGVVVGWGSNSAGQTKAPAGLRDVYAISAGNAFSLALKRSGAVVGWGRNSDGQLSIPVTNSAVSIAAGQLNSVIGFRNGSVLVLGSAALDAKTTRTPTRSR
ncbi:MAG: hypothetical protein RLY87_617 [Chloroflexota bacterium]